MIKLLGSNAYKAQLIPFFTISALGLLIWFGGPLLMIAEHFPLEQSDKRFYTIIALFLGWFLKIIFLDHPTTAKPQQPAEPKHPEFIKKLEQLTGRFQGAVQFLKKTLINKHGRDTSLSHLPWYLVIGPSGSGKTALLANSHINFILSKQFKTDHLKNLPSSDVCDWWVTRDSILIDVPGFYLQSKPKNTGHMTAEMKKQASIAPMLWQNFLQLVKKFRGRKSLNGVLITLPFPELANPQKEKLVFDLKQRIADLRTQFGEDLPFYLTITKCDLMLGFPEFFGDCGGDETSQAWGVSLPVMQTNESMTDTFINRFNTLIKRLNKQLIWRMHRERDPFTRPYIKDFPLQVERLKENVIGLLKLLSTPSNEFHLHGVFLSSAMQNPQEDAAPPIPAPTSTQTSLQIMRNPAALSRPYFIKQLLLQAILSTEPLTPVTGFNRYSKKMLGIAASFVGVVALFLGADIAESLKQTYTIRTTLAHYQEDVNRQGIQLTKAVPLLDALQKSASKSSHTLLFYSDKAQLSANAAYQQALRTIVIPAIKNNLENYIQTSSTKNPELLYAALETYLMLGDAGHMQPEFVTKQLQLLQPALFTADAQQRLLNHLNAALHTNWQPIALDQDIIEQARKHLFNLTPAQLSFVILKNNAANNVDSLVSLGTNQGHSPALISNQIVSQVPTMFTGEAFQSIYDQQIETAAGEATQGSWVLGSITTLNQLDNTALVEQLRTAYVNDYVRTWENVLMNIQLANPINLEQADSLISNLLSTESPLLSLLKTVRQNTHFDPIMTASPKLAAMNNLDLEKVFNGLKQTHAYLQTILNSKDTNKAAFEAAALRMKTAGQTNDGLDYLFSLAKLSPEPLKNWLNSIAAQSWHFILADASLHIEARWRTEVAANYHSTLDKSFPLTSDSNGEMAEYIKFLGTQGALNNFYQTYLQAFTENTSAGLEWKTVDNEKIPYTQAALNQVQAAQQLKQAAVQKPAPVLLSYSGYKNRKYSFGMIQG